MVLGSLLFLTTNFLYITYFQKEDATYYNISDFLIKIETDKTTYNVDEPITVTIYLENELDNDVFFYTNYSLTVSFVDLNGINPPISAIIYNNPIQNVQEIPANSKIKLTEVIFYASNSGIHRITCRGERIEITVN